MASNKPSHRLRAPTVALSLLALSATGCSKDVPPSPPDLCYRALAGAAEGRTVAVTTGDYRGLVLGRDPQSTDAASADCAGESIASPTAGPGCPMTAEPAATAVPVTDDRVVERTVTNVESLVWVMTHDLAGGEALGPVALVERRPSGVAVHAMGMLRAGRTRPSLRIERLGEAEVLVAEADSCEDSAPASDGSGPAATCVRTARLLLRDGKLFASPGFADANGVCVGPALVELSREVDQPLESGWQRRFALNASVEFQDGLALVQEQVTVLDSDPRNPDVPPRRVRIVDGQRTLIRTGGAISVDRPSLLLRVVQENGSMRAPAGAVAAQ